MASFAVLGVVRMEDGDESRLGRAQHLLAIDAEAVNLGLKDPEDLRRSRGLERRGHGVIDVTQIRSEKLRALYRYWNSKRHGRPMPARADIEPLEIPALLPIIYLVDVEHAPQRFRVRLIGTQICAWTGRDPTGLYVDDPAYGAGALEAAAGYTEVTSRREPFYRTRPPPWPDRDFHTYEELLLPLATNGETVDMLFCGMTVTRGQERREH